MESVAQVRKVVAQVARTVYRAQQKMRADSFGGVLVFEYPAGSIEAEALRAMPAEVVHRVVRVVRMEDGSAEVSSWR